MAEIWELISEAGSPLLWVSISAALILIYLVLRKAAPERRHFLKRFLAVFVPGLMAALLLVFVLKAAFYFERPCIPCGEGVVICNPLCAEESSFPSGHSTAIFAAVSGLLITLRRRGWLLLLIPAGLVAWSRVVLGVHYIGDVVAGSLIGAALPLLFYLLWRRKGLFQKKGRQGLTASHTHFL